MQPWIKRFIAVCFCLSFAQIALAATQTEKLALVYGKTLTAEQLTTDVNEALGAQLEEVSRDPELLKEIREEVFLQQVFNAIFDHFRQENHIVVSPSEITAAEKVLPKQFAEEMVIAWETNKALYEQYGGNVYRTREFGNLAVPFDAINAYIKQQEQAGNVKIYDAAYQQAFNEAISEAPDGWGAVPAAEVDFTTPWWEEANFGSEL